MRLEGESIEDLETSEAAWRLLAPYGVTPETMTLERHVVYTFRALWSTSWRSGRVLIAGDAAHQMPPFIGEGMNSGVRDSVSVAWRLDLVLRGFASPQLLDSYTSERLPHVQALTHAAVEIGRDFCLTDPVECAARDERLRAERDGRVKKEPPPEFRLGQGSWVTEDANAGYLGPQGKVEVGGIVGLFDDLVARRAFVLMGLDEDPADYLSARQLAHWTAIGGIIAHFGPGSPIADVDGTYEAWFRTRSAKVAVFRPDFWVSATGPSVSRCADLVEATLAGVNVSL